MLKSPLNAQIELTDLCNQRCSHCYNFWNYSDCKKEKLSMDDSKTVGKQLVKEDIFTAILTGGEPFLNREVLLSLFKDLRANEIDVGINTNLTLTTKEDLKIVKDLGITSILTSLCSYKEAYHDYETKNKGSFKKVMKGIEQVLQEEIPLSVNMVVTKHNVADVYDTGKFLVEKMGVKAFSASPISPCYLAENKHGDLCLSEKEYLSTLHSLVNLENDFNLITDVLEPVPHCLILHEYKFEKFLRKSCSAGMLTISVGTDTSVRPCPHSNKKYGKLNETGLKQIWKKMSDWREGYYIPKECEPCSLYKKCKGGCRTEALASTGSLHGLNPMFKNTLKLEAKEFIRPKLNGHLLKFQDKIKFRGENEDTYMLYSCVDKFLEVSKQELEYFSYLINNYNCFKVDELLDIETSNEDQKEKLYSFPSDLHHSRFLVSSDKEINEGGKEKWLNF